MDILTPGTGAARPSSSPLTRKERGSSTRHKLLLAAIRLGAQRGFSNVPLRSVVGLSGSQNISAVHYHFKNREGLLRGIMETIDGAWPSDLPPDAAGNVRTIFAQFLLNLETLKQADVWRRHVVRFLTRLCVDEGAIAQEAAAALLASRLLRIYYAVEPLCPGVPAEVLRLRVSHACLLLLTVSANLNQCYLKALGYTGPSTDTIEFSTGAVDIAASIIFSDWISPPTGGAPGILMSSLNTQVASPRN